MPHFAASGPVVLPASCVNLGEHLANRGFFDTPLVGGLALGVLTLRWSSRCCRRVAWAGAWCVSDSGSRRADRPLPSSKRDGSATNPHVVVQGIA